MAYTWSLLPTTPHPARERENMDEIVTTFVYPPIPLRSFDWRATRDEENGPCGWGETEQEAIDLLLEREGA